MAEYEKLVKRLVERAKRRGAKQAEAFLEVGRQSAVRVREGQIEDLTQATSKGVGLRVIVEDRLGFAYTSDFDPDALHAFADRAVELAREAAPNKQNGLPTRADLKTRAKAEALFDPEVAQLSSDWKIHAALEMEKAARAYDPRVATVDSMRAGDYVSEVYVASTEGLVDGYQGTYAYLYAAPVAKDAHGQLQTSYWLDYRRFLGDLASPEEVGREAARRAVRMLGARKVKSQRVPVVLDPMVAASFISNVAQAANGDAVHKRSSIFADKRGQQVASKRVSLVDDGRMPRGIGSAPFDGEGIATRRTTLIDKGLLQHFVYDAFTARKAKAESTGNAARGYSTLPHIGFTNLMLEPGTTPPEELIRGVKQGLYVTSLLGHPANIVTGEYSSGANGLWIENGELAFPVQEITVAGNMLEMLKQVDAVGSDLLFRGSVGAPTVRISELTVSGL